MAGGKGTRISSVASDIPKPMIKIGDKPVLEQEIESLKKQGLNDFIITISHLGSVITDYFGDGSKFGVKIEYYNETTPLGNAGALYELKEKLTDDFLLINGDVLFDFDVERFIDYHQKKSGLVTIFTHPNTHPYDSSLIITDKDNAVLGWLNKEDQRPQYYQNRVNAGIHIISPQVLENRPDKEKIDLDRDVLKPLCGSGEMYAYDSPEYVKDMGTPERYAEVSADFLSGKVTRRNLRNKQRAIFLDRDGTINKYVGFLRNINDFNLNDHAAQAIKKINDSEYLAIVVTNQPVIARGEVTFSQLNEIHNKMETLLGEEGAYLNAIYFCPHHPDAGYEGEVKELKIDCECRKPKPGMLLKAAKDFNLDLASSFMIGDSDNDVKAGKAAGCNTLKIETDGDLLEAIDFILENKL